MGHELRVVEVRSESALRPRVHYEFCLWISSKANRLALLDAVLACEGGIAPVRLREHGDIQGIVELAPEFVERFVSMVRLSHLRYQSPQDMSGRHAPQPLYESPEEELEARRRLANSAIL